MATKLEEGFDHYNSQTLASLKGWNNSAANGTTTYGITGRINGFGVRLTGGAGAAQTVRKLLAAGATEVYAGVALNMTSFASVGAAFSLTDTSGNVVCGITVTAGGLVAVYNSSVTTIATGTAVQAVGSWFYVELHAKMAGASGSVQTWVNGVADIAPTTVNIGSTGVGGITLSAHSNALTCSYDDIYMNDISGLAPWNANLGDVHVETLLATGDGTNIQWSTSTGVTHFNLVNENPPDGDLTYVFDSNVGDIDEYTFPSLSILSGTVYAVQTNLYARKDNASTRAVMANIRSGGTDFQPGASQVLTTSYVFYSDIAEVDPGTSSQWTISGVNNAQYGIKLTT